MITHLRASQTGLVRKRQSWLDLSSGLVDLSADAWESMVEGGANIKATA